MSKVYFTSDLHLGHENLCKGLRNMSSEESDNLIIKNWNNTITKYDTIYIVGDVTMEDESYITILNKLKGRKIVIGGNHDDIRVCQALNDIGITVVGSLEYKGYIITHIPIHPLEVQYYNGNIHGHIHLSGKINGLGDYKGIVLDNDLYFNVNTEFHNYTPIEFNQILEKWKK